jgi:MoaA/NifB/PqqE/SkfB family radical SAM enzyme
MIPPEIDFLMRQGNHPNTAFNLVEKQIAENAFNAVLTMPQYAELGFKRTYNLFYTFTFCLTRDPYLVKMMYKMQPYPWSVEMEVTQAICPLKCIMCESVYWNEKPIQVPFEKFKYAMDQFPDLKWAGNNALGDPFTNPDYHKCVKYLDDKDVVQELYLTTKLLNEEDMLKFLDYKGLVFLRFSFEGATKETYENIMVNSNYEKVIKNIQALDKAKKKLGRFYPELQFHFIIMKPNIHEAEMFVDFVRSLNIDVKSILFSRLLWDYPEVHDLFTEIPAGLEDKLRAKGAKNGINIMCNLNNKPTIPANECTAWLMPYIFPDGTVISCCCHNEANRRDWQRANRLGNIFEKPFREIWNDAPYKKLRANLWAKKVSEAHPCCNICNIMDTKNLSNLV